MKTENEPSENWQWYNPDWGYVKKLQDVRFKDGTTMIKSWPNAGMWNNHTDLPKPVSQTTSFKLSEND